MDRATSEVVRLARELHDEAEKLVDEIDASDHVIEVEDIRAKARELRLALVTLDMAAERAKEIRTP